MTDYGPEQIAAARTLRNDAFSNWHTDPHDARYVALLVRELGATLAALEETQKQADFLGKTLDCRNIEARTAWEARDTANRCTEAAEKSHQAALVLLSDLQVRAEAAEAEVERLKAEMQALSLPEVAPATVAGVSLGDDERGELVRDSALDRQAERLVH